MSYRPLTDVWVLARSKVKFFGAYPAGFLQRARDILNATADDQVLHVCSGKVWDYRCGPGCKDSANATHTVFCLMYRPIADRVVTAKGRPPAVT